MKKYSLLSLILCLILMCSFGLGAYAEARYADNTAMLLTDEEYAQVEEACRSVSESRGCGVYVALIDDFREYDSRDMGLAAEAYFNINGLGSGSDRNGILLMLSMNERDYYILCHGALANAAFTDYGKTQLEGVFLDNFRAGDWRGGLMDYVSGCAYCLDQAAQGHPLDIEVYDQPAVRQRTVGERLGIALIPSCIISLVICLVMKAGMKTAREKTEASDYIDPSPTAMRVVQDQFTHRTQSVQVIQPASSGSRAGGGGMSRPGGTTINSRGFSGKGGKF